MICKGCDTERDTKDFFPQLRGSGYSSYARCCIGTSDRPFREGHTQRQLEFATRIVLALKKRGLTYGSSVKQLGQMMVDQRFQCAICQSKFCADVKPHLDHDHATGKARGFLCPKCNLGLGQFEDSVDMLMQAQRYIEMSRVGQRDITPRSQSYDLSSALSDA